MTKRKKRNEEFAEEIDEERYFLNPEAVSQHLFCSICQEVFVDPQRAPCGHSYCKRCIHQWILNSRTCPEDRKPLRKTDLHHDFILENIIGDQMVACPFRRRGCEHVGQLQQLSSHKKGCAFNPANLPDFLKEDAAPGPASASPQDEVFQDSEDETLPTPVKPSLKMRLFTAGGGQRDLLCSMFSNSEDDRSPKDKKGRKS